MIYIADKICEINDEQFRKCCCRMPYERQKKMTSLRRIDDRKRCVVSYMMLIMGIKREYDREPDRISIGEYGKTFFSNNKEVFFNISHSGNMAACAISDNCIGIDVQELINNYKGVDKLFLSPYERKLLSASENSADMFTKMWTVKESYFKYIGLGIPDHPEKYDIFGMTIYNGGKRLNMETYSFDRAYLSICSEKKERLVWLDVEEVLESIL